MSILPATGADDVRREIHLASHIAASLKLELTVQVIALSDIGVPPVPERVVPLKTILVQAADSIQSQVGQLGISCPVGSAIEFVNVPAQLAMISRGEQRFELIRFPRPIGDPWIQVQTASAIDLRDVQRDGLSLDTRDRFVQAKRNSVSFGSASGVARAGPALVVVIARERVSADGIAASTIRLSPGIQLRNVSQVRRVG
jgi:hypothetical protein